MQTEQVPQNISDERKFRKPLMEKKRRARINESLENLKQILLECDPDNVSKKSAKLEKADILEMTVSFLQKNVRKNEVKPCYYQSSNYSYYPTDRYYSQNSVKVSSRGGTGGQYYYGGSSNSYSYQSGSNKNTKNSIWRPW